MPGRRVDVVGNLIVAVADCRCPCGFEHQDRRAGGSVRLVLRAPRDGKDRTPRKPDRAFPGWLPQGDAQLEVVARHSGVGTTANLRALMRRGTGLAPSQYRRRFGLGAV